MERKETSDNSITKGRSLDELLEMKVSELAKLIPSSCKRHLLKGLNKYENDTEG